MGVQFHPEVTLSGTCLLAEHCATDLTPGRYVQTEAEILTSDPELFASGHRLMDRILDYIALGIRSVPAY